MTATLIQIALLFGSLSLLAVGGGNGVIPDMQRAAVDTYHWMTAQQFVDAFAISRAAPGPGSLIVVIIGQKAAGLAGAAVAAVAMYLPAGLLVHLAARLWSGARESAWRERTERAMAPVAVGLTYASGLALLRTAEHGPLAYALTAAATLVLTLTDVQPLIVLAAAGCVTLLAGG